MDICIENGEIRRNANGLPAVLSGREELLQRARIALSMPQGSFRYDRRFGSLLRQARGEHREERMLAFANECLAGIGTSRAQNVRIQDGTAYIRVETGEGGGEVAVPLGEEAV